MDLRPVTPLFAVAPQLTAEDFTAAAAAGYRLVVNNRPDGEQPGQLSHAEASAAAAAAGLAYVHIPFAGGFGPEELHAMQQALQSAAGPVLAYCRSGTRSLTLWAHVAARLGKPVPELLLAAREAGYDLTGLAASMRAIAPA